MLRQLLIALLFLAFAIPYAEAAAPCASEQPDAPAYLVGTDIWVETNGVPGLQRAACEDAAGRSFPADTTTPRAPSELCVTVPIVGLRLCVI